MACSPSCGCRRLSFRAKQAPEPGANTLVHLPREAPWLDSYIHELLIFPNGRHDDQVDSTAQALDWFKQRPTEPATLTYYRRMSEQLDQKEAD